MKIETSIITPIHNAENFLRDTLDSILNQTYQDWEAILINDNSSDKSLEIALSYADSDTRFKIIDKGICEGAAKARNAGIKLCKGRFIAFLDSDDLWYSNKLESQIAIMKQRKLDFTFSGYHFMDEQGNIEGEFLPPESVDYNMLLKGNVIACLTAVYDTTRLGKLLMPDILKRQDFGLWLAITKTGVTAYGIQSSLAMYRRRKGSISSPKLNTMTYTWALYRNVENLSVIKSAYFILCHLLKASYKRIVNKLKR